MSADVLDAVLASCELSESSKDSKQRSCLYVCVGADDDGVVRKMGVSQKKGESRACVSGSQLIARLRSDEGDLCFVIHEGCTYHIGSHLQGNNVKSVLQRLPWHLHTL